MQLQKKIKNELVTDREASQFFYYVTGESCTKENCIKSVLYGRDRGHDFRRSEASELAKI